jgi:hypothetical protein
MSCNCSRGVACEGLEPNARASYNAQRLASLAQSGNFSGHWFLQPAFFLARLAGFNSYLLLDPL